MRQTDAVSQPSAVSRTKNMIPTNASNQTYALSQAKAMTQKRVALNTVLLLALLIAAFSGMIALGTAGKASALSDASSSRIAGKVATQPAARPMTPPPGQPIVQPIAQPVVAETEIILVIDGSGSMAETDPRKLRVDAVKLFRTLATPSDRMAIIQFGEKAEKLAGLSHPTDDEVISRALSRINSRGQNTDLTAALSAAVELLSSEGRTPSRKIIILLTDGRMDVNPANRAYQGPEYLAAATREERSKAANLESLRALRTGPLQEIGRLGWPVFTVAFTGAADAELLGEIAGASGGEFFIATDTGELHRTLTLILSRLHGRQTIPANNSREILIDSRVNEVTIIVSKEASAEAPGNGTSNPATPTDSFTKIIDPRGRTYSAQTADGLEAIWSGSALYDVLTVEDPVPGIWRVTGSGEAPMVVALTDVKLVLEAQPGATGAPRITAHLTEKGVPITGGSAALRGLALYLAVGKTGIPEGSKDNKPEGPAPSTQEGLTPSIPEELTKNVSSAPPGGSGGPDAGTGGLSSGVAKPAASNWVPLVDDGTSGDQIAGDGRFTATLPSLIPGIYRVTAMAISPTFRRQEEVFFTVAPPAKAQEVPAAAGATASSKVGEDKKSNWLVWLLAGLSGVVLSRQLASYRPALAGTLLDIDGGEDVRLSGMRQVVGGSPGASDGAACLEARRGRGTSATFIKRLNHRETVTVNGRPVEWEAPVSVGDEITVGTKRYIYQRIRS